MKKLTLALLAFLTVGAAAQSRHYISENGVIHVHRPGVYETRVVEVTAPVRVVTPAERVLVVPDSTVHRTILIDDDTADVPLIYPHAELDPHLYEVEVYRRTIEVRDND